MKYFLVFIAFIIIALVIFFPRTTKRVTDVATDRMDKKEQKVREIQEERENEPPEQKAAHGIEMMHDVIREFKPELY